MNTEIKGGNKKAINRKFVIIGGKKIYYTNAQDLKNKLQATPQEIKTVKENKDRYIHNVNSGEIAKFKPSEKPLFFDEFGVKKPNKKYYYDDITIKRKIDGIRQTITINNTPILFNDEPIKIKNIIAEYRFLYTSSKNLFPKPPKSPKSIIIRDEIIIDSYETLEEIIKTNIKQNDEDYLKSQPDKIILGEEGYLKLECMSTVDDNIKFNISKMGLKDDKPLIIDAFGKQQIEINNNNCVHDLLIKKYKQISANTIKKLGDINGVNVEQIKEFCKKYNIKMVAYDINLNVIDTHYPTNKRKISNLIFIAYNNHIYEIDNNYLKEYKTLKYNNIEYIQDLNTKLISFLDSGILPSNINCDGINIKYFVVNNILYHNNDEYDTVKEILKIFGLLDKLTPFMTLSSVSDAIEELYKTNNIHSFFPYQIRFNCGLNYINKDIKEDELITIDNNKHYPAILRDLDILYTTDIRYTNFIEKPKTIEKNYLYIATPKKNNILMPITDFYFGEYLLYCKNEGIDFDLLEGIQIYEKENYYKKMINDLYLKLDEQTFKNIMVRMIGRFNNTELKKYSTTKFNKICNNDETKTSDSFYMPLNDKYNILYESVDKTPNLYSKVLIRLQILTQSRKILYEKIKEMNLTTKDIKQIKTDSITFINKNKDIKNLGKDMGLWKIQEVNEYFKEPFYFENIPLTMKQKLFNNTIYVDYAGSGKTYHIINKLIPTLKDNYIILTPSHSALKEYRQKKINCNVIQKYAYNNSIPEEDIIIVDEIGMVNTKCNEILIKASIMGKKIYSFGDFKQLSPVNDYISNSPLYLNMMYKEITSLKTNHRNNLTFEYYDSLLNGDDKYLLSEVKKYNSNSYKDADIIICFRNETRKLYNDLMLEHLNKDHGDENTKIVCKTNDLYNKNIYNNFYYTVIEKNEDTLIITDDNENFTITIDEFNKYFEAGYCRTLYNIQGESIKSFFYAPEDYKFLDNVRTYTLISRLKTK